MGLIAAESRWKSAILTEIRTPEDPKLMQKYVKKLSGHEGDRSGGL